MSTNIRTQNAKTLVRIYNPGLIICGFAIRGETAYADYKSALI